MSILKAFNPYSLPEAVQKKNPLAIQREIILQHLLNTVTGLGVLGLVLRIILIPFDTSSLALLISLILLAGVQLAITAARKLPYSLRTAFLLVFLMATSLLSVLQEGFSGPGLIFAIAFITAVTVLIGTRAGYIFIAGIALAQALVGWMLIAGLIIIPINLPWLAVIVHSDGFSVLINTVSAVLLCAISIAGANRLLRRRSPGQSRPTAAKRRSGRRSCRSVPPYDRT